ncbi:MFS family permease [Phyllobacterium trifolii]|uniref:MFS family permease n=1 Tax=Phyllobacterium trifolii TaxID=300193 RepID=A0A839UBZ7_9HYPH|nr:MFS transporter [Phyllobacterium trifolii]MBB3148508.1 MFS family permease [Phyllobacterium trifolii]
MTDEVPSRDSSRMAIGVVFSILAVSFAARSSLGLGMQRWITDLSWTKSDISAAGSVALITMAIVVPMAGYYADRHGARRVLATGGLVLAVALASVSIMSSYWQFLMGYAVAGGVGFGLASLPVAASLVARSGASRPGLAMGIATAGTTAGQLAIIPGLAALFGIVGWRAAFAAFALLALAVAAFVLIKGDRTGIQAAGRVTELKALDVLKSRAFHGLFWSFLFCGFTSTGIVETHLIPFAEVCGFTPVASSFAYGVFAALNLLGMLTAGYLSDRIDRRALLVAIYVLRSIAFVVPLYVGNNFTLLLGFSVLVGVAFYATFPATMGLSAAHFGKQNLGLIVGLLTVGHSIGAACGAFAGGYIFDLFMKYDWVWVLSIGLAAVSAVLALSVVDPRSGKNAANTGVAHPQPAE